MRSVENVSWAAGPLVVLAYLAATSLAGSSQIMRARAPDAPGSWQVRAALAEALLALSAVSVGWHVTKRLAPGPQLSQIAFESVQVLLSWQSVALWCGAGAVLGSVFPVLRGFQGSTGLAAAGAIVAVHAPATGLAALAGFAVGMVLFGGRSHAAIAVALCTAPAYEWAAGAADLQAGWGVAHGPELTLWTAVVTVILIAGWWRVRPGSPTTPG